MKITKSFVDKVELPPLDENGKQAQVFYRDEALRGFALRVTSGGSKSFIVEKRIDGKVKRKTLGKYGQITAEQARKLAQNFLGEVAFGRNPIAEKNDKKAKNITLEQSFNDYIRARKDLKASTEKEYRRQLNSSFGDWKNKPLVSISKNMVEKRHSELGAKGEANANGAMRVLRAIFNHAINKYEDSNGQPIIQINPVARLSHNRAWYPTKRRQTIIRPHELNAWYKATLQLNQPVTRAYLHFVLLTGLRLTEAAQLRWQDVDIKGLSFTIPDTKNNRPHTLPITEAIYDTLKILKANKRNEWVFPSPLHDSHLKEPRTAVKRVCDLSGIKFTIHDLRRTFITIAESLDISAYALKRLLNHKDPNDVTAGYIISDIERLREPMDRISTTICKHLNSVNV
ncbi:integrase [Oleiphilus sp. HI0071]|uniref:tyrosine-type recombinase/integrase n=2 Tax=Oleiphilus sp. HI0080 TaxID=1822255 RepID=UPI0007C3ABC4|nr:tyrosine-type recombinase/integrase [Oleiphilus sp. HI0080]KZY67174.1 integrase [Oleiphilus sp. HI0065]KZY83115.1 integrase [Oleiphilus sp. HI0071]KZY91951.1 integrase [Oleiphilus sp. HI0073]KZZ61553.1 integrase [Oleiphilus sp. HI0122]KZZ17520.1 integrase [Oleiphilus sp. HI0080]